MLKAFQYRIYPTQKQIEIIEKTLNLCRDLYNCCLEHRCLSYKAGKSVSRYDQLNELPALKAEFPEYKLMHSQVLQDVVIRLDKAYQNFFRRVRIGERPGFPRYKGRHRFDSFTYPQGGFSFKDNGKLFLFGIGGVKIKLHRRVEGKIKTCSVVRKADKWYVSFTCLVDKKLLPVTGLAVGLDLGLRSFIATSDCVAIESPKAYRTAERKLRRLQRQISRREKGSGRRRKAVNHLRRANVKITNIRKDHIHKEARKIIEAYDTIVLEDLKILNMVKNERLAKSILDTGWGLFTQIISGKAEEAGRAVVWVSPHNTSRDCSFCGTPVPKSLSTRVHRCPVCKLVLDRDFNAAKNILIRGLSLPVRPA